MLTALAAHMALHQRKKDRRIWKPLACLAGLAGHVVWRSAAIGWPTLVVALAFFVLAQLNLPRWGRALGAFMIHLLAAALGEDGWL